MNTITEWIEQHWIEGELTLSTEGVNEYVTRVGVHIYQAYLDGHWTYGEAQDSLDSLNVLDDLWLGMPMPEGGNQ